MSRSSKFEVYNYDISLRIVMFLQKYNVTKQLTYKITRSSLRRLSRFITIFVKTMFANTCLLSLYNNRTTVSSSYIEHVTEVTIRGYEFNLLNFNNEYEQIKNPLLDLDESIIVGKPYTSNGFYEYSNIFSDTLQQMLRESMVVYGDGVLVKGDHDLSGYVVGILLVVVGECGVDHVITNQVLNDVAKLDVVVKIDNVLGGIDILTTDNPTFEKVVLDELTIDDITDDDFEIELKKNPMKFKHRERYPNHLAELIVD